MHPEQHLVIYRQQERELEQRLARRRAVAERAGHDRPGRDMPVGWRWAIELTARLRASAPTRRRRAPVPIARVCRAPSCGVA